MQVHYWQNKSQNYKLILNIRSSHGLTAKKRYNCRSLEADSLVLDDANDDNFGLNQWFPTASLQSIFCSTTLI